MGAQQTEVAWMAAQRTEVAWREGTREAVAREPLQQAAAQRRRAAPPNRLRRRRSMAKEAERQRRRRPPSGPQTTPATRGQTRLPSRRRPVSWHAAFAPSHPAEGPSPVKVKTTYHSAFCLPIAGHRIVAFRPAPFFYDTGTGRRWRCSRRALGACRRTRLPPTGERACLPRTF